MSTLINGKTLSSEKFSESEVMPHAASASRTGSEIPNGEKPRDVSPQSNPTGEALLSRKIANTLTDGYGYMRAVPGGWKVGRSASDELFGIINKILKQEPQDDDYRLYIKAVSGEIDSIYKTYIAHGLTPPYPVELLLKQSFPKVTQPSPWISVEERLPEENKAYWVKPLYQDPCVTSNYDGEKWWFGTNDGLVVDIEVTHWMPLPAAPTQENK